MILFSEWRRLRERSITVSGSVKTKRKVLSLGLAEKRFLSRDHLNFKRRSKKCQSTQNFSGSGFPFFFRREGKRRPIVCLRQQKGKDKKKSLFLNFQRTEITQRKQKQGWSEIILKLNIRFFFFLDIKKIWEFQKFSEFPMTKQRPRGLWIMENALCCFDSFLYLLSGFFCSRKSARLQHSEKPTSLPFPQNPCPNFFSQTRFQFQLCLIS